MNLRKNLDTAIVPKGSPLVGISEYSLSLTTSH